MGGKSTSTTATRLNAISASTSALGLVIPKVWGTGRLKTNMLWYGNFKSISHKSSQGGKGGGSNTNTTYTYTAALALGICSGTIAGIPSVYVNKSVFVDGATTALAQAGLSMATGAVGQSVWSWLTTNSPSQAIGYSGLAYLYASAYSLDSQGNPPNITVEVKSGMTYSTLPDAKPSDILTDFLTSTLDGVPGWPSGALGSLTNYGTYCLAANLLLSPVIDSQVKASSFVDDLMASTNSMCFWSEGLLKVTPLGDATVTANSTTWNPSLSPAYTLNDDSFLPPSPGEPPISFDISDQTDAYNIVQVEFLDRANQYNSAIVARQDDSNIQQFGPRKQDPKSLHMICDKAIAANVCQILLQNSLYVRGEYHFSIGWHYALLEPTDLLSITDTGIGISNLLVRITQIDDDEFGVRSITAVEVPIGAASPPTYAHQDATAYAANQFAAPGASTAPVLITPPSTLTNNDLQVWIATSGGVNWGGANVYTSTDGTNYQLTGQILGGSRYGVSTTTLPLTADIDVTNTLGVNLAISSGTLLPTTTASANAAATLCLIDSELIAYRDATLTSANHYNLGYFRRGLMSTTVAAHASNAPFVRLDDTLFQYSYQPSQAGLTVYVKLQAFNLFGNAAEDISTVTAYPMTLPARTGTTWSSVVGVPANIAALTGSEPIQNTLVGTGHNALLNTEFQVMGATYAVGYTFAWQGNFGTTPSTVDSVITAVGGQKAAKRVATYASNPTGSVIDCVQVDPTYAGRFLVPVTPGDNLMAMLAMASQGGAGTGYVKIGWFNAAGSYIAEVGGGSVSCNINGGTTDIASWPVSKLTATVPADGTYASNVRFANIWGRFDAGTSTTLSMWCARPFLAKVPAGQTAYPPYTPGPNDRAADQTSGNTAAAITGQKSGATTQVTYSASAPSSPVAGDIWIDTSATFWVMKNYSGSAWITSTANWSTVLGMPSNLSALTGGEAIQNSTLQSALTGGTVVPAQASNAGTITGQTTWATYGGFTPTNLLTANPNLLLNPTGRLGVQKWVNNSGSIGSVFGTYGEGWYFYANSGSGAGTVNGRYQDFTFQPGFPLSISGYLYSQGLTVNTGTYAQTRMYIQWLNGSGTHISYSSVIGISAGTGWTLVTAANQVSPAGTATARVWIDNYGDGTYTVTNVAWKNLKVENGTVCTPYSDGSTYGASYTGGTSIDALQPAEAGANVTGTHTAASITGQGTAATLTPPTYAGNTAALSALGAGFLFTDSSDSNKIKTTVASSSLPKVATGVGTGNITTSGNTSCAASFTGLVGNGVWSFNGTLVAQSSSTPYTGGTTANGTWALVETKSGGTTKTLFTGTWASGAYSAGAPGINFSPDATFASTLNMSGSSVSSANTGNVTVTLQLFLGSGSAATNLAAQTNGITMSVQWTPTT